MSIRRRQRPLLGTFVEIAARCAPARADAAITIAFEAIAEVHRLASFHDGKSELSRLNRSEGDFVELPPVLLRALHLARAMTRLSGGLFNCTVGGAMVRQGVLPDHGGTAAPDAGTADDIEIRGRYARLRNRVRVTLDGIAKGFAVDVAIHTLKSRGIETGFVNAGGDVRAFGADSIPISVRTLDGRYLPACRLHNAAVATSRIAPYRDLRFPGAIVSPEGGTPHTGVWSVVAAQAWRADALTKVAALASPRERENLILRLRGKLLPQPVPVQVPIPVPVLQSA